MKTTIGGSKGSDQLVVAAAAAAMAREVVRALFWAARKRAGQLTTRAPGWSSSSFCNNDDGDDAVVKPNTSACAFMAFAIRWPSKGATSWAGLVLKGGKLVAVEEEKAEEDRRPASAKRRRGSVMVSFGSLRVSKPPLVRSPTRRSRPPNTTALGVARPPKGLHKTLTPEALRPATTLLCSPTSIPSAPWPAEEEGGVGGGGAGGVVEEEQVAVVATIANTTPVKHHRWR